MNVLIFQLKEKRGPVKNNGSHGEETKAKVVPGSLAVANKTSAEGGVKSLLSRMNGCFLLFDICD